MKEVSSREAAPSRGAWTWLTWLAAALMVFLRCVALRSDPFLRLDWSGGLLTDEGFYIHNARNVAVFGTARTDEFNNMLLSPLLHLVQTGVFRAFGAGALQARSISVVCGIVALWLFWKAMSRVFGFRIAGAATLLLGLDHVSLLYGRMALMDTPAMLGAVAAFYAFVRGADENGRRASLWLGLCGLLLGLTVISRTLCVFLIPVPFAAVWMARGAWRAAGLRLRSAWLAVCVPILAVIAVWGALWYVPHRAEISRMTRYYRVEQIQPRSVRHLYNNVYHAVLGDFRGLAPYLFRHETVPFALAIAGLAALPWWRRRVPAGNLAENAGGDRGTSAYLALWLVLGWIWLAVISYSPSRYYVVMLPAMYAVAGITVWRLPDVWARLRGDALDARLLRGGIVWLLVYHAAESWVHHGGVAPHSVTIAALFGLPSVVALAVASARMKASGPRQVARWAAVAGCLWLATNGAWLGLWLGNLRWTQYEASRWLGRALPAGSVLIGDVAPGLSMNNRLVAVNVIPGLCNGDRPVEAFAGRRRYVCIMDGRWKEVYWQRHYPELVAPERRLRLAHVMRWDIGLYAVDDTPGRTGVQVPRMKKK